MQSKISKNPMGIIEFVLNKGETITAEKGAMVYSEGDISIHTQMRRGGFFKSLKTAFLGGESFFVNNFEANEDNCKLGLTGNMLGDIQSIAIEEEFIVQSGAFVCSTNGLTLDTQWQGFTKGIFGTNLFMLKTIGEGELFVNGWGGIIKKELKANQKITVDNYQLVALSAGAEYHVTRHGSLKTTLLGGEALVIEITGPGTVYLQTKNFMNFVSTLLPYIPKN